MTKSQLPFKGNVIDMENFENKYGRFFFIVTLIFIISFDGRSDPKRHHYNHVILIVLGKNEATLKLIHKPLWSISIQVIIVNAILVILSHYIIHFFKRISILSFTIYTSTTRKYYLAKHMCHLSPLSYSGHPRPLTTTTNR